MNDTATTSNDPIDLTEPLLSPQRQQEEESIATTPKTTTPFLSSSSSLSSTSSSVTTVNNNHLQQQQQLLLPPQPQESACEPHHPNNDNRDAATNNSNNSNSNPWKNRNVLLSLALCIFSGVADSIWGSVVLSGFLLALAKAMGEMKEQNTLVGTAEAIEGLALLITALPVGILADCWGKAKVVQSGGLLMLLTIALTLAALVIVRQEAEESRQAANQSYYILVAALFLWGVLGGISYGPSQALYADSIPKGKRSEMLTWLYSCYLLSSAAGPVVSIVLLLTVSGKAEDWSIEEIFPVFFIGVLLEIPAAITMFFFSDKYAIVEQEDSDNDDEGNEQQPLPDEGTTRHQHGVQQEANNTLMTSSASSTFPSHYRKLGKKAIPYVLFFSSLVVALGSGASVKYFPLFFKELGLSSAAVQGIFLVVPIGISGFSFIAQRLSKLLGRVETAILSGIVGTSLLYFMTWLSRQRHHMNHQHQHHQDDDDDDAANSYSSSLWKQSPHIVIVIIGVYLLRTGIMNSSYPLLESILMDNVPSNRRARWKSLESIAQFGWTGSALVGGILSDQHSYEFTFAITATMQLAGCLLLLLIQPFVEAEQPERVNGAEDGEMESNAEAQNDRNVDEC